MTDETLKPCPFCGAVPTIKQQDDGPVYAVVCGNEPCDKSGLLIAFGDRGNGIQDAITAWNTRTTREPDKLAMAVEALQKAEKIASTELCIFSGGEQARYNALKKVRDIIKGLLENASS